MSAEEWLSVSDAAAELGVDPRTVRGWCESKRLPAIQPGGEGGKWMIRRSWWEMFLRNSGMAVDEPAV